MASIWKHPKSPYWTACYTNHLGKQVKRSTKQENRKLALKLAQEWEGVEKRARQNRLTTVQIQKVAFDLVEKLTGESLNVPTVEAYLNDWLAAKKQRGSSDGTGRRYLNTVRFFLKSLGDMAQAPITSLAPRHIEQFLRDRLASGRATNTAVVDVKTLAAAFGRAERYGLILKNPVSAVELPKVESIERETFSHEEVHQLIKAAAEFDSEWQTVIMLGYFTGARLGDCLTMKWSNLDIKHARLTYRQGKTKKMTAVPVHVELFHQLNEAWIFCELKLGRRPEADDFITPELASRCKGGKQGVSATFKRIMEKAGLDAMTGPGSGSNSFSRRSFHSLRYSFNSTLANAGVSQEIRVKFTGHSSLRLNDHYTKLAFAPLQQAIATLPNFHEEEPQQSPAP